VNGFDVREDHWLLLRREGSGIKQTLDFSHQELEMPSLSSSDGVSGRRYVRVKKADDPAGQGVEHRLD
jgi:hypothetical protein